MALGYQSGEMILHVRSPSFRGKILGRVLELLGVTLAESLGMLENEKLTESAAQALALAEQETRKVGHDFIGTGQVLAGILAQPTGVTAKALQIYTFDLNELTKRVRLIVGHEDGGRAAELEYSPGVKRALKFAKIQAAKYGSETIGTEHLLLGLLLSGSGVAQEVLEDFEIDPEILRARIEHLLAGMEVQSTQPCDEYSFYFESRDHALQGVYDQDNFLKKKNVPSELLAWLEQKESLLGVYFNAEDDYVLICEKGLAWFDGDAFERIDYDAIESIDIPEDDDPYLKLTLRSGRMVPLPILHHTDEIPDIYATYEYLSYCLEPRVKKMSIQEIESREDFVLFLRQDQYKSEVWNALATWLERGGLKPSWLESFAIPNELVSDPAVWRLIALLLVRFPQVPQPETK